MKRSRQGQMHWRRLARDRACSTRSKIHVRSTFDKGAPTYKSVMYQAIFHKIVLIAVLQPKSLKTQGLRCTITRISALFTRRHGAVDRPLRERASSPRRAHRLHRQAREVAACVRTLSLCIPRTRTIVSTRTSTTRNGARARKHSAKRSIPSQHAVAKRGGT
jgi:hypothetical protein